jgi:hypothetical protein
MWSEPRSQGAVCFYAHHVLHLSYQFHFIRSKEAGQNGLAAKEASGTIN